MNRAWILLVLLTALPLRAQSSMAEAGLVDLRTLVDDIALDIRYAGSDNFVGQPIDGYGAPRCYLLRAVAEALADVETDLRTRGLRLLIFDCYRPQRAVAHFMRWARDLDDQATKAVFYPSIDKSALVGDYIAEQSGHSRGATVDLGLLRCDRRWQLCEPLDMGTEFDFFDVRAHTDHPDLDGDQRLHRNLLRDAMAAHGFANYPLEWWHYSLPAADAPGRAFDLPIAAED